MSIKAGIITFHCVPNYGAVLQAYGLQQVLKNMCDTVEVIDYRPKSLTAEYRAINFHSVISVAGSLYSLPPYLRKTAKFARFERKHMSLSGQSGLTAQKLGTLDHDFAVLGSDQIWNSQILGDIDPVYFGRLRWQKAPRILSYAASIGKGQLPEAEQHTFRKLLEDISAISVREEEARQLIAPLTDRPVEVVVDPTVLAGAECFRPFVKPNKRGEYVLCYSLTGNPSTNVIAESAAKKLGLPLAEISGRRKGLRKPAHEVLYDAGPEEFVSLIANAAFVVTDSFHGTVFSLLFHRPFITIPHQTRGGRLLTLLDVCGLHERCCTQPDDAVVDAPIDWENSDRLLAQARENSLRFLQNALAQQD